MIENVTQCNSMTHNIYIFLQQWRSTAKRNKLYPALDTQTEVTKISSLLLLGFVDSFKKKTISRLTFNHLVVTLANTANISFYVKG